MKEKFFAANVKTMLALLALILFHPALCAQNEDKAGVENAQELADKLANPVASLISVPLQNNLNYGIGPYNGVKYTINVQPVVPFKLSDNLNLITRYILPVVDQRNITGLNTHEFRLSDATVTAFFAPRAVKLIYGIGPAFLFPLLQKSF